jgi:hypothetical protein
MSFPLVCGAYDNRETVGVGGDCPVCFRGGSLELERAYSRACFCFLPLFMLGTPSYTSTCVACGSRMPAAVITAQPGFVSLVPTPWSVAAGPAPLWRAPEPAAVSAPLSSSSQPPAGGDAAEATPLRGKH